jgi:hypothetical protein
VNRGFLVLVGEAAPGRRLPSSSYAGRVGRVRWRPAGLVDDEGLAEAMVRLVCERSPSVKACVVPVGGLVAEVGGEEAERIFDRLHNPTTAEIARSHELEREAAKRLSGKSERRKGSSESAAPGRTAGRVLPSLGVEKVEPPPLVSVRPEVTADPVVAREREPQRRVERRSSVERRGGERRQAVATGLAARVIRSIERRESVERRSGVDRREPRQRLKAHEDRLRRLARRHGLVLRKSRRFDGYSLVLASTMGTRSDPSHWGTSGRTVVGLSSLDEIEAVLSDDAKRSALVGDLE